MRRPVIGISSSQFIETATHGTFTRHSLTKDYSDAVHAVGGVPLIIPYYADRAADMIALLDGIIFSGGSDLAPSRFGESDTHPETYGVLPERDEAEFALLHLAVERGMPVLGICRGIQLLNVAFGGTLYQDVPDQCANSLAHRQHTRDIPADQSGHMVSVMPGSLLDQAYGAEPIPVNSFHHQAVKDLAPGLVASGWSDDGLVEAIERPASSFVLGVQWHPELMFKRSAQHLAPFSAIVQACQRPAAVAR